MELIVPSSSIPNKKTSASAESPAAAPAVPRRRDQSSVAVPIVAEPTAGGLGNSMWNLLCKGAAYRSGICRRSVPSGKMLGRSC